MSTSHYHSVKRSIRRSRRLARKADVQANGTRELSTRHFAIAA